MVGVYKDKIVDWCGVYYEGKYGTDRELRYVCQHIG